MCVSFSLFFSFLNFYFVCKRKKCFTKKIFKKMISFQWFLFGDRSREISTILKSLQDSVKGEWLLVWYENYTNPEENNLNFGSQPFRIRWPLNTVLLNSSSTVYVKLWVFKRFGNSLLTQKRNSSPTVLIVVTVHKVFARRGWIISGT